MEKAEGKRYNRVEGLITIGCLAIIARHISANTNYKIM